MSRKHPLIATLGLLALLGLGGVFNGATGVLMVAPFLLLIALLLAGHYPGEEVIARIGSAFSRRPGLRSPARFRLPEPTFLTSTRFLLVTSGTRGPPASLRS